MDQRPATVFALLRACLACVLAWLVAMPVPAQELPLDQQVRALALKGARGSADRRVEIEVGQLDPRLKLAPCERVEPYLPSGATLWGRSRVGLRCLAGPSRWNVYLPVTVKVFAPATVAAAALPAGAVLAAADLKRAEVDLAEESSPVVADAATLVGRTVAHALRPGEGIREAHLKPRVWFAAGDTVQVVARGDGFSAALEAQAITPGIEGQPARVRHESGKVLTGRAVGQNRMELGP